MRIAALVTPGRFTRALLGVIGMLLAASLVGNLHALWHGGRTPAVVKLFDVNRELNLPTLVSTLALLLAAAVSAVIGRARRSASRLEAVQWGGLAVIFCYLGLDEGLQLHERYQLHGLEPSSFARWIPVGAVLVLLVGLAYLPFVVRLPPATRRWTVLAGLLYVGGALGLELGNGLLLTWGAYPRRSALHVLVRTVEEGLEMTGVALYLHGVLDHVAAHLRGARATFFGGALEVVLMPAPSKRPPP